MEPYHFFNTTSTIHTDNRVNRIETDNERETNIHLPKHIFSSCWSFNPALLSGHSSSELKSVLNRITIIIIICMTISNEDNSVHCFLHLNRSHNLPNGHGLMNMIRENMMPHLSDKNQTLNTTTWTMATDRQPRFRRFLNIDLQVVDHNQLPLLNIGEILLNDFPECESWFEQYRIDCQKKYEISLRSQIVRRHQKYLQSEEKRKQMFIEEGTKLQRPTKPFTVERNAEYIKQASCCGIWQARNCLIDAINADLNYARKVDERICPSNLVQRFRQLPTDPAIKEDVLDYCSEYGDGSRICSHSFAFATHQEVLRSVNHTLSLLALVINFGLVRLYFNW